MQIKRRGGDKVLLILWKTPPVENTSPERLRTRENKPAWDFCLPENRCETEQEEGMEHGEEGKQTGEGEKGRRRDGGMEGWRGEGGWEGGREEKGGKGRKSDE